MGFSNLLPRDGFVYLNGFALASRFVTLVYSPGPGELQDVLVFVSTLKSAPISDPSSQVKRVDCVISSPK